IEEQTNGHDSPALAGDVYHLAMSYEQLGQLELALEQLERLALLSERLVVGTQSEVGRVFFHLSRLHFELGDLARAEECAVSAVPMLETTPGPELAFALETLAAIYAEVYRNQEAAEAQERARLVWKNLGLTPPPKPRRQASV